MGGGRATIEPDLGGKEVVEVLGVMEVADLDLLEGPGARVGKGASAGNASVFTTHDLFIGAVIFLLSLIL